MDASFLFRRRDGYRNEAEAAAGVEIGGHRLGGIAAAAGVPRSPGSWLTYRAQLPMYHRMPPSTVWGPLLVGVISGLYVQRLARQRAEGRQRPSRRFTAVGVSQVILLLFGLSLAGGAALAEGVRARALGIMAVVALGALVLTIRAGSTGKDDRTP
jgi:hypothetical protein